MYTIYTASTSGEEIKEGYYVDIADDFEMARKIAEAKGGISDGLYDCYMIKDYSLYWLLKYNKGGWDFFYSTGTPLIVNAAGLSQSWYDFEFDADDEKLKKAKKAARNGSYQAIYDAYQSLGYPSSGYSTEFGTCGAGLVGFGFGLSDFGSIGSGFDSDRYDFGSCYSDLF